MIFDVGLAILMGFAFGFLLQFGRVANCNVISGQFCLRDFTMVKVMVPAIIVGGLGVLVLVGAGDAKYYIKDANILAVGLGAAMFGVALTLLGYCPGTAIAAIGSGSVHALFGFAGMVFGGILYALSFDWVKAHILPVWAFGKIRLPAVTGISDIVWFAGLAIVAGLFFFVAETRRRDG